MANEFVARKGLISSGSINVSGSVTASYFKGDGAGLTGLGTSLSIDTYKFVGNGSTTNYILSSSYSAVSLLISVAGISYTEGLDYTLSGSTLAFLTAPPSSSNILIKGLLNNSNATGSFTGSFIGDGAGLINVNAAVALDTYLFTGSGATTNYVLSQSYTQNNTFVTLDGLTAIAGDDFTISGATVTFTPAPISQSIIAVRAFANIGIGTGSFSGSFAGTASAAISASYATTASAATSITFTPTTASFATTASAATSITFTPTTASFATTASAATSITFTPTTASFATTASYANNYAVGKAIAFSLIF